MDIVYFIAGVLLIATAIYDITYTTLAPKGAGVITSAINQGIWKFALLLSGRNGKKPLLSTVGYLLLYAIIIIWILMMWLGNALMFYSDTEALVNDNNEYITSFTDKIYYTGYVMSTMGLGDFHPVKSGWKIYSALLSFIGLILLTLSISYIIPVINAVAAKNSLSTFISNIGKNPKDILQKSYDGKNFRNLEHHMTHIQQKILLLTQSHQAYPILHYFHSTTYHNSASINICSFDEVLFILIYLVDKEHRPSDNILIPTGRAFTGYFQTLKNTFIEPEEEAPPIPNFTSLNKILPIKNDQTLITKSYEKMANHRKVLNAYLKNHGWTWKDMATADYTLGFSEKGSLEV